MSPINRQRQWVDWSEAITCVDIVDRRHRRLCRHCGQRCEGQRRVYCSDSCQLAFDHNHFWGLASGDCFKRAGGKCQRCGSTDRLEVNHIDPVMGGPRHATCKNHADNLELLCHPCHVRVTEEQFRPAKAAQRRAQGLLV